MLDQMYKKKKKVKRHDYIYVNPSITWPPFSGPSAKKEKESYFVYQSPEEEYLCTRGHTIFSLRHYAYRHSQK